MRILPAVIRISVQKITQFVPHATKFNLSFNVKGYQETAYNYKVFLMFHTFRNLDIVMHV